MGDVAEFSPGEVMLGRLVVVRRLRSGGTGAVYEIEHQRHQPRTQQTSQWPGLSGALAALVLASGCAHFKPECEVHGGGPWRELTTAHFRVRTNLEPDPARRAAKTLEYARAALRTSFAEPSNSAQPLDVLLLLNDAQVQDLVGQHFVGGSIDVDWRGPHLVLSGDGYLTETNLEKTAIMRGLSTWLAHATMKEAPRWVIGGVAQYLETLTIDVDTGTALRGKPNTDAIEVLRRWGVVPLPELWDWKFEGPNRQWHQLASSWLWVHFLTNRYPAEWKRFVRALEHDEDARAAWLASFGAFSPDALLQAAEVHLAGGTTKLQHLELSPVEAHLDERLLMPAEVHAALARAAAAAGQWDRASAEAAVAVQLAATADAPGQAAAFEERVVTERDPAARRVAARELVKRSPDNARAWLLLALCLDPGAEAEERTTALARAVELDATQPIALIELAAARAHAGDPDEAVALAERALAAAPSSVQVWSKAAEVFGDAKRCARAAALVRSLLERVPAGSQLRTRLEALRAKYQACAAEKVAVRAPSHNCEPCTVQLSF